MDFLSLKDIPNNYFGSIFLDNLTLTCALRTLDHHGTISLNDQYIDFQKNLGESLPDETSRNRREKWDYNVNNAFRFAIDIYSLAQVIEAIILFDNIFIDSSSIQSWSVQEEAFGKQQEQRDAFHHLMKPVRLDALEHLVLLNDAMHLITEDVQSDLFPHFLALLSQTSTENVFLHMSHGYFKTGYSDQALFPDIRKFTAESVPELFDLSSKEARVSGQKSGGSKRSRELLLKLSNNFIDTLDSVIKAQQEKFWLRETEFYRGDSHDKLTASQDIIRNALAAYFYESIAARCGLGYLPHLMRSYFLLFHQTTRQKGIGSTASSIVHCLQEFRTAKVKTIDAFYKGTMIDLSIPFVLAFVLEKASKPSDILPIALELRDSKQARDFRSRMADIDYRVATGKIDLTMLSKEIESIRRVVSRWMDVQDTTKQEMTSWSISLSRGISHLSLPFPLPARWQQPRSEHLLFLQRLAQVSNRTPRFDGLLQKVFGSELAAYWQRYRQTVDTLTAPPAIPEGRRLSPLSKEDLRSERKRGTTINILFLAANPKDTTSLRLDEEMREIDQAIRESEFRERFTLHQHWAVRVTDLQGYLLRHKPDIVHFSGHGTSASEIILEDKDGNSHVVTPSALNRLFSLFKDHIRCVVLNSCYSEQQAHSIAQHIDCVVGMSTAIGDPAAISFATAFYRALGYGMSVKTAFDLGCSEINLENLGEQDIPKLLATKSNPVNITFGEQF